jgi:tRNA pseudouridine32 synthase/23S rRNA pseudouridine746 synthase
MTFAASAPCFIPFKAKVDNMLLPEKFTFPFYYQPHQISQIAAKELQQHLLNQTSWQHNFGLTGQVEQAIGKMFGVLVVKNQQGKLGYLAAFSGKLANSNSIPPFVPPVFDLLAKQSFFHDEQLVINQLNEQLLQKQSNSELKTLAEQKTIYEQNAQTEIQALQQQMVRTRKHRKAQRLSLKSENDFICQQKLDALAQQSIAEKNALKQLKQKWQQEISNITEKLLTLNDEISTLKQQRKTLSNALQHKIFEQYQFLNVRGEKKSLNELFAATSNKIPPAGAGECAAPKLLNYAFKQQYQVIAMAEFWWGASPKSEIRKHQQFYPACIGKCQPILTHMLLGLTVDENPFLQNTAADKILEIVYQDDDIVVVNKPEEFLSVPGKNVTDSVYTRIAQQFPTATGSLIVHRLDMSTSGLMVLALNSAAHKKLQQQFIKRRVEKTYVALLEGLLTQTSGIITLPLRGDLHDRPRQQVCFEHGKTAETHWQLVKPKKGQNADYSRVYLSPKTGRTHQLRMHCAHTLGLNMPIVGDDLYGNKADRLYLHAESLTFSHPTSGKKITFNVPAAF